MIKNFSNSKMHGVHRDLVWKVWKQTIVHDTNQGSVIELTQPRLKPNLTSDIVDLPVLLLMLFEEKQASKQVQLILMLKIMVITKILESKLLT